jgi:hypothetical protein
MCKYSFVDSKLYQKIYNGGDMVWSKEREEIKIIWNFNTNLGRNGKKNVNYHLS